MTPIDRQTLTAALEEKIIFGHFKPRERLVEQGIMEDYDARRHVVRASLDELCTRGLAVRLKNRGVQVADLSNKLIEELYFMRELLHRAACEQMPHPLPDATIKELQEIQQQHDAVIEEGDFTAAFYSNERFHSVLNHACNNSVLEEALSLNNERTNLIRSIAFQSKHNLLRSAEQHHAIIAAAQEGDKETFINAVLSHILTAKKAYIDSNRI